MSDVKMCDNCGDVFSVNESGWTEYTQTQRNSREPGFNNQFNHGAKTMHMGPCCAKGNVGGVRPRIAMRELENGEIETGFGG